jgi:hypothetical protein
MISIGTNTLSVPVLMLIIFGIVSVLLGAPTFVALIHVKHQARAQPTTRTPARKRKHATALLEYLPTILHVPASWPRSPRADPETAFVSPFPCFAAPYTALPPKAAQRHALSRDYVLVPASPEYVPAALCNCTPASHVSPARQDAQRALKPVEHVREPRPVEALRADDAAAPARVSASVGALAGGVLAGARSPHVSAFGSHDRVSRLRKTCVRCRHRAFLRTPWVLALRAVSLAGIRHGVYLLPVRRAFYRAENNSPDAYACAACLRPCGEHRCERDGLSCGHMTSLQA